jgi:hypothetical protein
MKNKDFLKLKKGDKVLYVPLGKTFTESEIGYVSSVDIKNKYVHVKFKNLIDKVGWDNTTDTACRPSNLLISTNRRSD